MPSALGQVQLEQPVVAEHLEREALALGGQLDAAVGLVADEAERVELLDHRPTPTRRVTPRRSASAFVVTALPSRCCSA